MPPKRSKSAKSSAGKKKKGGKTQSPTPPPPDHPEDIFPLVLTSATQELFGCRTDEDVTRENPYKLLKKDDIIQDMRMRATVSDFTPARQIVLDYPEEELLLVFDRDFTYGVSFYLVVTPEAKERMLKPPEPETQEEAETEINKTPEPKEWISLGSEQEVDEESVGQTREKALQYVRLQREVGKAVSFSDCSAADAKEHYLECASYQDSRFSITQMQRDCGTQAVPTLQSSSAQTHRKFLRNLAIQYVPRVFSKEEVESILQSESLNTFCSTVTSSVLLALQQEVITNVFFDELKALSTEEDGDWSGKVSKGLSLHQAFTDQMYSKHKSVGSVHWHPTIHGVIAVALKGKQEELLVRPAFIVFYSFSDPSNPQLLLECPDDIFAFDFCPSNPNIIVGGCSNGQVVLWDISTHVTYIQGTQPSSKKASVNIFDLDDDAVIKTPAVRHCAVSALESSHKAPITDVQWLPPTFEVTRLGAPVENLYNICVQVVTCSPDCTVMFWDVRKPKILSHMVTESNQNGDQTALNTPFVSEMFKHLDRTWKPLFRVSLPNIHSSGEYAPLKFSLEHYTCNSSTNAEHSDENEAKAEVTPEYSQLSAPSAKSGLRGLDDVNTKFYAGTDCGEIIYTDWKIEKDDSGHLYNSKPLLCFRTHHCSVNTIQRSPFFRDIVLTVGNCNFAIWKEEVMDGPIILSPNSEHECTAGCWSPTRPAVFFIGKEDGSIEVWNLLEKISEPMHVHAHITNTRITCIRAWTAAPKQHFLAVADDLGMLRIIEIPKTLYNPSRKESSNVQKRFGSETDRLQDYLKRGGLWEQGLNKQEAEKLKKEVESEKQKSKKLEVNRKLYSDFLALEESQLRHTGLQTHTIPRSAHIH
ncbi:dynein axonemal intermediate chain 3 [Parambassis ranga]|uniref:Dynein axonemal intermediate chain 3 n=1 Tax=Parambassis ranga TaxID=210632 RepID=A0A6P7IA51_9TELE|nr:WD repeat-containing protein 63 [Parambassis ranga]